MRQKNIVFEGRQAAVNYKDESEPLNYYQPQDCFNLTVINQPMKTKRDGIKKKGTERGQKEEKNKKEQW